VILRHRPCGEDANKAPYYFFSPFELQAKKGEKKWKIIKSGIGEGNGIREIIVLFLK